MTAPQTVSTMVLAAVTVLAGSTPAPARTLAKGRIAFTQRKAAPSTKSLGRVQRFLRRHRARHLEKAASNWSATAYARLSSRPLVRVLILGHNSGFLRVALYKRIRARWRRHREHVIRYPGRRLVRFPVQLFAPDVRAGSRYQLRVQILSRTGRRRTLARGTFVLR